MRYDFELDRITIDPQVMGGQPCIRGIRIPVSIIIRMIAAGNTTEQILAEYPELEKADIKQALEYAAWSVSEKNLPVIS